MVIQDIRPRTPHCGSAKAVVGERIRVTAAMFKDGHDPLAGRVLLYAQGEEKPEELADLRFLGNDEWEAFVVPARIGPHHLVVQGWSTKEPVSGPRTPPT